MVVYVASKREGGGGEEERCMHRSHSLSRGGLAGME